MMKDLAREELIKNRARHNNYALTEDVLYLFERIAALESALRALVAGDPTYWSDMSGVNCCFCSGYDEHAKTHDPACPWLAAQALVGAEVGR